MTSQSLLSGEKKRIDKKAYKRAGGFTLVELIVVLVIVGILAAVAVPTFLAFMDMGREKEYRNNAAKSLSATQAALSDVYADAGSALTPDMRKNVKELVFADDDELAASKDRSGFVVWTEKKLHDGQTTALLENIGSYTISKALYYQDGTWLAYDGSEWKKYETKEKALTGLGTDESSEKIIYVWPYNKRDYAYLGDDDPTPDVNDPQEEAVMKIVTFRLDASKLDKIFFAQEGRNDNSGKESLDILFWKNGTDAIESYWSIVNGIDLFKINDYYTYRIACIKDLKINKITWKENSTGNTFDSISEIQNYIFSEQNGNKAKEKFEFTASFDTDDVINPERATFSKSAFAGMFNARTTDVTEADFEDRPDYATRVDINSPSEGEIYAWRNGTEVCWCSNANNVYMPADCSSFFSGNTGLEKFDFSGILVSEVTTMENMFSGASNLKEVYLSNGFNAGTLTNVRNMFNGCEKLASLDSQNLYTGTLSYANGLFRDCKSLKTISFPTGFNTGNVTDFSYMFSGCENLTQVETKGFVTSNPANYESMFAGCKKLGNVDVNLWTGVVPLSMKGMFSGCAEIESIDIHTWDTSTLTSLEQTFDGCSKLKELNMSGCSLESVRSLNGTFKNLSALERLDVGDWNLLNCTDMTETFAGCINLRTLDVSKIKTTNKLTSLKGTFKDCAKLVNINVSNFNSSNVSSFSELFRNCSALENIIGIEKINTSSANDLSYMFAYDDSIKVLDLGSFNTKNVGNFEGMFFCNNTRNNLKTINVSPRFVVNDACKNQEMFKNNMRLTGGAGTVFDVNHTKGDYALIDGYRRQKGYFTGTFADVYIKKDYFKTLFTEKNSSGQYILINGVEQVPFESYTKEQVVTMGATKVDDGKNTEYCAYAWKENDTVKWWSDADRVFLPNDCSGFFNGLNLKSFSFEGFETEKITNMQQMFRENRNLETVIIPDYFHFENVTNLYETFYYCISLKSVDLSDWELEKAERMYRTFSHCENATFTFPNEMHLNSVNTLGAAFEYCYKIDSDFSFLHTGENLTVISYMFSHDTGITTVNLSGLNVENLTTMQSAFEGCTSLNSINISGWKPEKLTSMQWTFKDCSGLTSLEMKNFGFASSSTNSDLYQTFLNCTSLQTLNLSGWDVKYIKSMNSTFSGCTSLNSVNLTGWEPESLITMQYAFYNCGALTSLEMKNVGFASNSSNDDMKQTFANCTSLQTLNLSGWDVKNVKSMNGTFMNCKQLSTLDITGWAPESLTNFDDTFRSCSSISTIDLSLWKMKNVTTMYHTFTDDSSLTYITLGDGWEFENCTQIRAAFQNCKLLNQDFHEIKANNKLTIIKYLFDGCSSLVEVDLSGLDTQNVSDGNAEALFNGCKKLEKIYVSEDLKKSNNNVKMFTDCDNLVGGNNTAYANMPSNNRNLSRYAVIDNGEHQGYLTLK